MFYSFYAFDNLVYFFYFDSALTISELKGNYGFTITSNKKRHYPAQL